MKSASAASFGQSHDQTRLAPCGRSVASTVSITSSTSRATGSVAIRTHLLLEAFGDAARDDRQLGRIEAAWSGQVDSELLSDAARPVREDKDAVAEAHGFARVVGHEKDGQRARAPQADELLVQEVARDRVDRTERLVHEQDVGVLRQCPRERHALL